LHGYIGAAYRSLSDELAVHLGSDVTMQPCNDLTFLTYTFFQ